jgi:hypothetical protein
LYVLLGKPTYYAAKVNSVETQTAQSQM